MPSNQLLTTSLIANTALAEFANNSPYIMTGSRMYQDQFTQVGYKVGDQIQLRRQNQFIAGDGQTASPQSILETTEYLTISHQYNALITYTMQDLTLRIQDFNQIFLQPAIQTIITKMERDIAAAAEQSLYLYTGTAGTPINSFSAVDLGGVKLMEMGVDISRDAYVAMTLRDGNSLKAGLIPNFTPVFNEEIVRQSAIGHLSYFDLFQSQNVVRHTAGAGPVSYPGDTLLVNGTVTSGNTIVLSGATINITNYFVPGDLISIANVHSVNPLSHASTGQNMQFVVTNYASSSAGGAVTVTVSPSIISDQSNPLANVDGPVLTTSAVTVVGSHNCNVAYTSRALDIVCPPLFKLQVPLVETAIDPDTGLSLTITQIGDVTNYQNYLRLDVLCGFSWHPQYASLILS